jgi:RsiW-degrading membrane proteinase PrsW (M82 family)
MVTTIDTSSLYTQTTIVTGIANAFSIENINPNYFVLVIGIYVVELVVLLIRFTNGIDKGDDTAEFYHTLSKALPLSILILTVSLGISQIFLSNITMNI